MSARAKTRTVRSPATPGRQQSAVRRAGRGHAVTTMPGLSALEGEVHSVDDDGVVHGALATGEAIRARCPAHIDREWLRAAARLAPIDAVFVSTRPSGRMVVWGIFPGRAHDAVAVDVRIRGRQVRIDAESVHVGNEKAHLRLEKDGNVSVRGRDVTSHARRVNRVKGGAVRLN